jgi:ABC-type antimicrobial peptide transport system permease subunit
VLTAVERAVQPAGAVVTPVERPPELTNLRDIVPLPRAVGAFLALLGVAALLHVLSSSARAHARDFAVLRAIGVTRGETSLVLRVQGLAVFLAGLALGIPLGIAAGRVSWQLVAQSVPLGHVSPVAAVALICLIPAALAVSQLVATAPGLRLRRLRPAEVLRSE